jgi:hypothetical protein
MKNISKYGKAPWQAKSEYERCLKKAKQLKRKDSNAAEVAKLLKRAEVCRKFFEAQLELPFR